MLKPRIIPCLLIRNRGLVKTVGFDEGKYVGDPINAVRIFNEKKVDELIVVDIDATRDRREPDYKIIEKLAAECRMPFCYGGGVKTTEQAKRIIGLGVEKVALSRAAVERPELVSEIAGDLGSQSVIVVLDVKKRKFSTNYRVWTHNATIDTGLCPIEFVSVLETQGVGEIVVNSISNDGAMQGYDLTLMSKISEVTTVPLTALGGAGNLAHLGELIKKLGVVGAAAGSIFVFKGTYKAVLINYPSESVKQSLYMAP